MLNALEASPRASKWFADDTVQPGEWIQFEAPLNYAVMETPDVAPTVLLLDARMRRGRPQSHVRPRLLLHGSAAHLLGSHAPAPSVDLSTVLRDLIPGSAAPAVRLLIRDLQSRERTQDSLHGSEHNALHHYPTPMLRRFVRSLDHKMGPESAAWTAGYARVTIRPDPTDVLVATPLYVEFVEPGED